MITKNIKIARSTDFGGQSLQLQGVLFGWFVFSAEWWNCTFSYKEVLEKGKELLSAALSACGDTKPGIREHLNT